jgi:hypothetical protein
MGRQSFFFFEKKGRQSFGFGGVVSQPDFRGVIVRSLIVGSVNPIFQA